MNLIGRFVEILEESKCRCDQSIAGDFQVTEQINGDMNDTPNLLAHGDNGRFMKYLSKDKAMDGKLKLIYIDPPFFSKATYDAVVHLKSKDGKKLDPIRYFAYDDTWQRDMTEYLKMLCYRLYLMKDLLADDGTIWIHLDWHVVHYAKIFLDEIFGEENFVNEIIWQYKSGGSGKRHFARKHDTILVYSKTKKYYFAPGKEKSYNRGFKPYRFKGVKEYKDEMGWYTMVTMKDIWNVDMVGRTSSERTGYATQKPEALLARIIEAATEEGDLCADFFCGSGTLAAVAEKMGRKWICCDSSNLAISKVLSRMREKDCHMEVMEEGNDTVEKSKANFSFSREALDGSDKELIKIVLEDYAISKLPKGIEAKGIETIKYIQKNNPLQLIECWSVDFNYDGKVFRPEAMFSRENTDTETVCEKLMPRDSQTNICIKTIDVLGNDTMTVI